MYKGIIVYLKTIFLRDYVVSFLNYSFRVRISLTRSAILISLSSTKWYKLVQRKKKLSQVTSALAFNLGDCRFNLSLIKFIGFLKEDNFKNVFFWFFFFFLKKKTNFYGFHIPSPINCIYCWAFFSS